MVALPAMLLSEHVVNDYQTLRLSLKAHPMSFLRERLRTHRVLTCHELRGLQNNAFTKVAGIVLVRQRPGSAQGVVFMTLEDETGIANAVVWPKTLERFRRVVMCARLILIHGRIQRHDDIIHVVSTRLEDRSDWLLALIEDGATLKIANTHADEVRPKPNGTHDLHCDQRVIPSSRDFH
jgi:error-prone DNA polymerase